MIGRSLGALVTVVAWTVIAGPAEARDHQRLHLLGADTHHLYWSVDPEDPELAAESFSRQCGNPALNGTEAGRPCLSGTPVPGQFWHTVFFYPGSVLDAPVRWDASSPLRFHLELDITPAAGATVHFGVDRLGVQSESGHATEIAPGVWEGTLSAPAGLDSSAFDLMYVRIKTPAPRVRMDMATGGRSYVDLPAAVPARSVPDLIAEDAYRPEPQSLVTPQRSFEFNDAEWSEMSFSGDLTEVRDFDVPMPSGATAVLAWAEVFGTPMLGDVAAGTPPDTRKFTDGARVRLLQDGRELVRGGGFEGRGQDAAAAVDVAASPLTLRVEPTGNSQGHPYTAHVLVVLGDRTLRSMRWSFNVAARPVPGVSLPSVTSCLPGTEPLPATSAVRSIALDLDWSSPGPTRWTPRYGSPDAYTATCGQDGTGDRVRLTIAGARVWGLGAIPARDSPGLSVMDTVFEMEARFTYGR